MSPFPDLLQSGIVINSTRADARPNSLEFSFQNTNACLKKKCACVKRAFVYLVFLEWEGKNGYRFAWKPWKIINAALTSHPLNCFIKDRCLEKVYICLYRQRRDGRTDQCTARSVCILLIFTSYRFLQTVITVQYVTLNYQTQLQLGCDCIFYSCFIIRSGVEVYQIVHWRRNMGVLVQFHILERFVTAVQVTQQNDYYRFIEEGSAALHLILSGYSKFYHFKLIQHFLGNLATLTLICYRISSVDLKGLLSVALRHSSFQSCVPCLSKFSPLKIAY